MQNRVARQCRPFCRSIVWAYPAKYSSPQRVRISRVNKDLVFTRTPRHHHLTVFSFSALGLMHLRQRIPILFRYRYLVSSKKAIALHFQRRCTLCPQLDMLQGPDLHLMLSQEFSCRFYYTPGNPAQVTLPLSVRVTPTKSSKWRFRSTSAFFNNSAIILERQHYYFVKARNQGARWKFFASPGKMC